MDHWLDRYADALGVPRLDPADVEAVLDLARDVAHGTERRNAPLATYLAGRAAAAPSAAAAVARSLLGGADPSDGPTRSGS